MRLDERKEQILNFVVRDYVRTAFPVPSAKISQKGALEASPATIRIVLSELEEDGYVYQPHTSAGRVPTELGYRYFVERLMEWRKPDPVARRAIDKLLRDGMDDTEILCKGLSAFLAQHLQLLSGVGIGGSREQFSQQGLSEVLREPEFNEHNRAIQFAERFDCLEKEIAKVRKRSVRPDIPEIEIGEFGMVTAGFQNSAGDQCVIFTLGPQRMNYEKASSLLRYIMTASYDY